MDIGDELLSLDLPDAFIVRYLDGTSERLLRGNEISVTSPSDDPEGIGGFDALIPKNHPRHQHQGGRYIRYNELDSILDECGSVIYSAPSDHG
ncbi:hypothetical protein LF1_34950 [Rubripirellula obstinata]|uniref:Uncharacterized protein n=2 Tax=Rubripirellula obstinata TaxID=406547 RepID=A0A5B1CNL9_9BACT|nr:hypothetical protein LF1_34950 [Rubripirellula obstinata]